MSKHNYRKLKAHILRRSEANDFHVAISEWHLDYIYITEKFGRCPCGVRIKEHCVLRNDTNGNSTFVGNVCVGRFMDIDATPLFRSLNRIRSNTSAKPNLMLINYAWERGYLYGQNEYGFLFNINRRRNLSEPQLHWLRLINRRIIESIVVRRLPNQIDAVRIPNQIDNNVIEMNDQSEAESSSSENTSDDDDEDDYNDDDEDEYDIDDDFIDDDDVDDDDSDDSFQNTDDSESDMSIDSISDDSDV